MGQARKETGCFWANCHHATLLLLSPEHYSSPGEQAVCSCAIVEWQLKTGVSLLSQVLGQPWNHFQSSTRFLWCETKVLLDHPDAGEQPWCCRTLDFHPAKSPDFKVLRICPPDRSRVPFFSCGSHPSVVPSSFSFSLSAFSLCFVEIFLWIDLKVKASQTDSSSPSQTSDDLINRGLLWASQVNWLLPFQQSLLLRIWQHIPWVGLGDLCELTPHSQWCSWSPLVSVEFSSLWIRGLSVRWYPRVPHGCRHAVPACLWTSLFHYFRDMSNSVTLNFFSHHLLNTSHQIYWSFCSLHVPHLLDTMVTSHMTHVSQNSMMSPSTIQSTFAVFPAFPCWNIHTAHVPFIVGLDTAPTMNLGDWVGKRKSDPGKTNMIFLSSFSYPFWNLN